MIDRYDQTYKYGFKHQYWDLSNNRQRWVCLNMIHDNKHSRQILINSQYHIGGYPSIHLWIQWFSSPHCCQTVVSLLLQDLKISILLLHISKHIQEFVGTVSTTPYWNEIAFSRRFLPTPGILPLFFRKSSGSGKLSRLPMAAFFPWTTSSFKGKNIELNQTMSTLDW